MMQCPNCDREIPIADSQFCPFCGSPLDVPVKKKKNDATDKIALYHILRNVVILFGVGVFGAAVLIPSLLRPPFGILIGFLMLIFLIGLYIYVVIRPINRH
jgi:hypothetical protein